MKRARALGFEQFGNLVRPPPIQAPGPEKLGVPTRKGGWGTVRKAPACSDGCRRWGKLEI